MTIQAQRIYRKRPYGTPEVQPFPYSVAEAAAETGYSLRQIKDFVIQSRKVLGNETVGSMVLFNDHASDSPERFSESFINLLHEVRKSNEQYPKPHILGTKISNAAKDLGIEVKGFEAARTL